jgi:hypothetical protein
VQRVFQTVGRQTGQVQLWQVRATAMRTNSDEY